MSLKWRLILSYVVIIVVSLTLAFLTLILVARPIQNRLAGVRLTAQSKLAAGRFETLLNQSGSLERVLGRFNTWGERGGVRLVLVDPRLSVLADTEGVWQGQPLEFATDGAGHLATTGVVRTPNNDRFNFAATPVTLPGNESGYVAAVSPRATVVSGLVTELGWGFVAAGLVALLVSLILGLLITRSIALPLQRMAAAAGAATAGNYNLRLPETGPPEIKRVAAGFNLMLNRVEGSQQAMRDLVSNVSHELKTPLTSIQGFSQAIMEGATATDEARRRAAAIIHQEANRMTRLVTDLLDLARIDSGQVVMQQSPLDLAQILEATAKRLLPQAVEKQIKLVKQWPQLPPVVGDGDRLAQVFTNLLDNALHHTPSGGRVVITGAVAPNLPHPRRFTPTPPNATTAVSARADFVEISMADTGPGIPPAELARIFERFYQVDKSRKRGRGTGLGLAITKEIVDAHGGQLRAESVEGVGTKITVLLPVSPGDTATVISPRAG